MSVTAQINIRYQLLHDSAGVLHKFIGPNYFDTILSPEIDAQARDVISKSTRLRRFLYVARENPAGNSRRRAKDLVRKNSINWCSRRPWRRMTRNITADFLASSILILDTLVLGIDLPPAIVAAINRQTEQYYMIQEYKYRVQRGG